MAPSAASGTERTAPASGRFTRSPRSALPSSNVAPAPGPSSPPPSTRSSEETAMPDQPERPLSRLPDVPSDPLPISNRPTEAAPPDPRIEDYLDCVSAPLVEVVPYTLRQELRAELREHLTAMA